MNAGHVRPILFLAGVTFGLTGPILVAGGLPCVTDSDCDDGNVCTFELCSNGTCAYGVLDPCCPPLGPCPCTEDGDCKIGCCNPATGLCQPPPCGIPTVSTWGLIVLTLLVLTLARVSFGRWHSAATMRR